jgi:hypothetical protein
MRTLTFTLQPVSGVSTPLAITLTELMGNAVQVAVNSNGTVSTGDITAVFFNFANDAIAGPNNSLDASGTDVTAERFQRNSVSRIGQVSFGGGRNFDGGVAIGTTGGSDFITSTVFTLSGVSISNFVNQQFGVRLQGNQGSSSLIGTAAGNLLTGAIGDFVFFDTNRNGIQNAGEPGVAGVAVQLLGAGQDGLFNTADDLTAIPGTVTDINGKYLFSNLAAGNYQVIFDFGDLPNANALAFTKPNVGDGDPNVGADNTIDSDAIPTATDPTIGITKVIPLAPGQVNPHIDAGLVSDDLDIRLEFDFAASSEFLISRTFDRDGLPDGSGNYQIETDVATLAPYDGAIVVKKVIITNNGTTTLNDVQVGLDLDLSVLELLSVGGATLNGTVLEVNNVTPGDTEVTLTFQVNAPIEEVNLAFALEDNPAITSDWGVATGDIDLFLLDGVFQKPSTGTQFAWGDISEASFTATLLDNLESANQELTILNGLGTLTTGNPANPTHALFTNNDLNFDLDGAIRTRIRTSSLPGVADLSLVWLLEPFINPDDPQNGADFTTFAGQTGASALALAKQFVLNSTNADIFSLEYAADIIQKLSETRPTLGFLDQTIINLDGTVNTTFNQKATAGELSDSEDATVFYDGSTTFQAFIDSLAPGSYCITFVPFIIDPNLGFFNPVTRNFKLDLNNYNSNSPIRFKLLLPDPVASLTFFNTTNVSDLDLSTVRVFDGDSLPIGVTIGGSSNNINIRLDRVTGTTSDDQILGGDKNDILNGGLGNDRVKGGNGNDTLNGGQGDDTLVGNNGNDVFVFDQFFGMDVIQDFNRLRDSLDLSALGLTRPQFNAAVSLSGSNTVVDLDEQGQITLRGVALTGSQIAVIF